MIIRILFGVFMILHGLVHLLYFGQSAGYFELQPGMVWPDGAWVFSKFLGDATIRILASVLLIIAACGFVAGGGGVFLKQSWWRPMVVGAAVFSSVIYILFWDGALQRLADKGLVGILINAAILVVVLVFQWPNFEF
jgi:uncharacterized membrane protein YkvI